MTIDEMLSAAQQATRPAKQQRGRSQGGGKRRRLAMALAPLAILAILLGFVTPQPNLAQAADKVGYSLLDGHEFGTISVGGNYDPKPEDLDAPLPPLMAVRLAAWKRDAAEKELAEAVNKARAEHVSWRQLGEAIGTSGEAARQRYSAA